MGKSPDKIVAQNDSENNEDTKKIPRQIAGALAAVPAAIVGAGLGAADPRFGSAYETGKLGAKTAFYGISGDKESSNKAMQDYKDAAKREKGLERKKDTGETTNAMGDKYKKGGTIKSASSRADGCAIRGKTKA